MPKIRRASRPAESTDATWASWRETATENGRRNLDVDVIDELESLLDSDDWVMVVGTVNELRRNGASTLGSLPFIVSTRAIHVAKKRLFGGLSLFSVPTGDVNRFSVTKDGPPWLYIGATRDTVFQVSFYDPDTLDDFSTSVQQGHLAQHKEFPLARPGSPAARANDLEASRAHASAATPAELRQLVAEWNEQLKRARKHDLTRIWKERCAFGISIGPEKFRGSDWYLFNALPALAGLRLGEDTGFPLASYCGLATEATLSNDPRQVAMTAEIKRRFHGR